MIFDVDEKEFATQISTTKTPIVVYFYAPWCNPCKTMDPIFNSTAQDLQAVYKFMKISIDRCPKIASQYKIVSIPTIVLIKDQATIQTIAGSMDKDSLTRKLEQALK